MSVRIISEVEWENAGQMLQQMTDAYTGDNMRKLAFNYEIFPLVLKFKYGDRSTSLFYAIFESEKSLMKDFRQRLSGNEISEGYFMNPGIKPAYSDVLVVLGSELDNWQNLFKLLKVDLKLRVKIKFYADRETWVFEFYQHRALKIILIPDKNNFILKIPSFRKEYFEATELKDFSDIYPIIDKFVKVLPNDPKITHRENHFTCKQVYTS